MEVAHERVAHSEVVGREYEFVGPARVSLDVSVHSHGAFHGAESGSSHGAYALFAVFCSVHELHQLIGHLHLL